VATRIVWPAQGGDAPFPVTRLGERAGWSHRSPLGLGIHPRFGLWFAYRGVVLLDVELPTVREATTTSPCAGCAERPCVAACPPGAVGGPSGLDLVACVGERERAGAACGGGCLARAACPVGAEHRYSDEQAAHHQRFGTAWLRRAVDASASAPSEWSDR
jgi:epoxyqueuosine reductase